MFHDPGRGFENGSMRSTMAGLPANSTVAMSESGWPTGMADQMARPGPAVAGHSQIGQSYSSQIDYQHDTDSGNRDEDEEGEDDDDDEEDGDDDGNGARPAGEAQPDSESAEKADVRALEQYYQTDMVHLANLFDQFDFRNRLIMSKQDERNYYYQLRQQKQADPGAVYGPGFSGFGNGTTNGPTMLMYPADRKRVAGRRAKELAMTPREMAVQAESHEELVPIRLDLELEKVKLRDTFTWNLHEHVVPVELFAETLVEDFQVPDESVGTMTQQVSREIHEQLQDYYPHIFLDDNTPSDGKAAYTAHKNDDIRVLIKLNVTVDQLTLIDQFEWDINNPLNSAEDFARSISRDLALSGEFTTAIAHQIREQVQLYTRSLYIVGHPFDGRPVDDIDLHDSILPSPVPVLLRPAQAAKDYAPYLYELNEQDLQREELAVLREQRRQKRQVTRRGGPPLPDLRDRPRTARTLVVSSIIPGSAESVATSRLLKVTQRHQSTRTRRSTRGDPRNVVDDSDLSDSDDDVGGTGGGTSAGQPAFSPPPTAGSGPMSAQLGRARVRNAASAAQAAMKASLRNLSPDGTDYPALSGPMSSRRSGVFESDEPPVQDRLVAVLRFSPGVLQRFWADRPGRR